MSVPTVQALFASIADDVDVSHHACTDPGSIFRFHHLPDKLMSEDAGKVHVAGNKFQVGVADASPLDA